MTLQLPGSLSHHRTGDSAGKNSLGEYRSYKTKWYFTKEEIEEHTPSRKDGISHEQESHLLQLYSSYLQELGVVLKLPQMTIATAMLMCHRFYMHQSHAKNHWQAIANASMFLACKTEDTSRWLKDITFMAYKLMYRWDPSAARRIRQKEVYDKQKNLILMGEQLILVNIAFDLNIELPYKPLVIALKSLKIHQKEVVKVAWNFVNDWLRTTLCLQYKPHYIAAGSIFLAAKFQKIKLPELNGRVWWMQFDVSPKQLEEVIQHMLHLLGKNSKHAHPVMPETKAKMVAQTEKRKSESTESCISNELVVENSRNYIMEKSESETIVDKVNRKESDVIANNALPLTEDSQTSCSTSTNCKNGYDELMPMETNQNSGCKIVVAKESYANIDVTGIRERLKRRKISRLESRKSDDNFDDMMNGETWIERELEKGIDPVYAT